MKNKRINIASLEFDQIKENLKTFLQGQAAFSDYDFEGSNMSILLDVLAYNTHYNAMYANMALNEAYMDSASKRNSVVSLGKMLGYVPRSRICARGKVSCTLSGVSTLFGFVTLPKGTAFTSVKDSIRYYFYTTSANTAQLNATNTYNFVEMEVVEGVPLSNTIPYTEQNVYVIPNRDLDITTLEVRVQDNAFSTSYKTYLNGNDVMNVTGESLVYFIREVDDGYYQISFGDNIIGKALEPGNLINLSYYVSSGEEPNGISVLSYAGDTINGGSLTGIQMDEIINGGRYAETTEEIRYNAPNFYASQNRVVTSLDYETLILSKVPSIESVAVWGGENNVPPIYGKVFISAKTVSGDQLTYAEKQNIITNVLDKYRILTTIPEFVDPNFIDVDLDLVAYYDATSTTKAPAEIAAAVTAAIIDYNDKELQKFNRILRTSAISRIAESAEESVISCVPRLRIRRSVTPIYNKTSTYNVNIGNPFAPGTISTTGFYINGVSTVCYIDDDSEGTLTMYTIDNAVRTDIRTIGTVDYTTGYVTLSLLNIIEIVGDTFEIIATPSSADVASIYNQVVQINTSTMKISIIADSTAGKALLGDKFVFTSNRLE